jgi:hypothetical protein
VRVWASLFIYASVIALAACFMPHGLTLIERLVWAFLGLVLAPNGLGWLRNAGIFLVLFFIARTILWYRTIRRSE